MQHNLPVPDNNEHATPEGDGNAYPIAVPSAEEDNEKTNELSAQKLLTGAQGAEA